MMNYDDLIAAIAERSGLHSDIVKKVLFHLPDALLQMGVGGSVRTPLGVFRMIFTEARESVLPDRETETLIPAKITVKLKPGNRLKIVKD